MYIHEAVKKAMEIDGYMYLIVDGIRTGYMKPTETSCILYHGDKKSPSGWQPRASHLLSDKWEIISEKSYELLSQLNKLS